jgi:hypothetical protein
VSLDADLVGNEVEAAPAPVAPPIKRASDRKYVITDKSRASFERRLMKSTGARIRSALPILGYAGHNGSGKTMAMVFDAQYSLRLEGRPQLSTVPLFDTTKPAEYEVRQRVDILGRPMPPHVVQTGPLHPLYVPLVDWTQLLDAHDCDVLLDEVQGVASSRGMNSLPPQLLSKFLQLRRADVRLRWTTVNWTRVDKALREVTYNLALCSSGWPDRYKRSGPWTPRRRFKVRLVDSTSLDSVETIDPSQGFGEGGERLKTFHVERRVRRRNEPAMYDTYGHTIVMNHVSEGGWCVSCGGTKNRPRCSCGTRHD